jgi:hypothetical protein
MEHQLDATITVLLIFKINETVIVAPSRCSIFYFTYIDDARSNTNHVCLDLTGNVGIISLEI